MTDLSGQQYFHPSSRLAILAIAALLSLGATCGDLGEPVPPESDCLVDSECLDGQLCVDGRCMQSCVVDDDCDGGVCRSELRPDQEDIVDVCVAADDSSNQAPGEGCDADAECIDAFGGDQRARCGIDGVCFIPQLDYGLLVRDTTVVDATAPAADGGLGADIAAMFLLDPESNEPVAWADTVAVAPANGVTPDNEPDGASVPLSADGQCVDGVYDTTATPLGGDGGYLLVRFLDSLTGNVIATPPSTWNIVVIEWGANCPEGELGEPDSFELLSCAASSHKAIDVEADCSAVLASGSGRVEVSSNEK